MKFNEKKFTKKMRTALSMRHFDFIKKIKDSFQDASIYLVGGAVRDLALDAQEIQDFDFVVKGVDAKELEKLLAKLGNVNLVGKTFGVFKFVPETNNNEDKLDAFDIALPRTEQSIGHEGIYNDFEVQSDPSLAIEEDLARRDFTINAIAWDIINEELIDPYNGLKDIEKKLIQTVGDAPARFQEDYSRMLRAIRFACQLGFDIDKKTFADIKKRATEINNIRKESKDRVVPYEIIAKEFVKSFFYNPVHALDLLDESGLLEQLIPEILAMKGCKQPQNWHSEGDVWQHTKLCLKNLQSPEFISVFGDKKLSAQTILATLFHDIGKPYTQRTPEEHGVDRIRFDGHDQTGSEMTSKICKRLKLSSVPGYEINCEKLAWIVKFHLLCMPHEVERMKASTIEKYFLSNINPSEELLKTIYTDSISTIPETGKSDIAHFYLLLKRINGLKELIDKEKREIPALLTGDEVMQELSMKPGPRIGNILGDVREEQLQKRLKRKEDAIEWIKEKYTSNGLMI